MPEIIFSEKNPKYVILNHLYFAPNFIFGGTAPVLTLPLTTTIKKLPTALKIPTCSFMEIEYVSFVNQDFCLNESVGLLKR